jgi:hypothetical protein
VFYPLLGPPSAKATQRFGTECANELVAAFMEWAAPYGQDWDRGDDGTPDPPGWDLWRVIVASTAPTT